MQMIKKLFGKGLALSTIWLCSILLPLNVTHAATVSFHFTGVVSAVSGPLSGSSIANGATVNGLVTFTNDPATGGVYQGVVTGFSIDFGTPATYTASMDAGANGIRIINTPLGGTDQWRLDSKATGNSFNGYTPTDFEFRLLGQNMFTNNDLQAPNLSAILSSASRWRLIFENNNDGESARVQGTIAHLTAVPLPTAVLLFGAGLISLVGLGAGGLRNLRGAKA